MITFAISGSDEASVLGEAVLNAGAKLSISQEEVGKIIGRDRTTIVRKGVHPTSKQGQLAMILVRIYRGLYALLDGNEEHMHHWMHTRIGTLQAVPAEMLHDVAGFVRVLEYIDAMRGKV